MDRPRNGSYKPVPVKLIMTKLNSKIDPGTQEVIMEQTFIGGDRQEESHCSVCFEGLTKGVYVAIYQAEFLEEPERKLVFSVYCTQQV